MIDVFGFNLGISLGYPLEGQNYTFSTISLEKLTEILEQGDYRRQQVFYLHCKPNKEFVDFATGLLKSETYTQVEINIRCMFADEPACMEAFRKLQRKFKSWTAAGGLVLNEAGEFLAIYARGRWALPKGHVEPDESPREAAVREVEEETGLLLPTVIGSLPLSYHVFPYKGKHVLKTTHWFLMHVSGRPEVQPQMDEGIEEVRWMNKADWIASPPPTYPQTQAYLQQYFSQPLVGE